MNRVEALREIRRRAADSANILPVDHAVKQMIKRKISRLDIERCLRGGRITEGPYVEMSTRQQRCKVECGVAGDVITTVVEIPEDSDYLEVVTVF